MAEEEMFTEAMGAIQAGEKKRARDLLTRLLKINPDKADYWIWMSSVVDTSRERIYCLQEALKVDAQNLTAKRGLVILGAMSPDERGLPPPGTMVRRKWQVAVLTTAKGTPRSRPSFLSLFIMTLVGMAAVVVIGLIIYGSRSVPPPQAVVSYHPTKPTAGPSPTYQPTFTPVVRSATPTFTGPTPLWMLLQATYTPTPLYVPTPRSQLEAARAGMTAFMRGDYAKAISFLIQVATTEPNNVDAIYYLAESYRLQGDYTNAVRNYVLAMTLQPSFAPAYLGRAEALLASTPSSKVMPDLQTAVANDPNLGEAYLQQARVALANQDYDAALDFLDIAGQKMSGSATISLYQAEAYLGLGQPVEALASAEQANQLDLTLLPSYRVLGEALQANGRFTDSIQPLTFYLLYQSQDVGAWVLLGKNYSALQDWTEAGKAFEQAIQLDGSAIDAYLGSGDMYLSMGNGQSAGDNFKHALLIDTHSFDAKIGIGRADLLQGLKAEAYNQFNQAESLAASDAEKAVVYYWRATASQALGQTDLAMQDWQKLMALPEAVVPAEWAAAANQALTPTLTSTITATASVTPTASLTPTVTTTPTLTPTSTRTSTVTSTPKPSPTPKP